MVREAFAARCIRSESDAASHECPREGCVLRGGGIKAREAGEEQEMRISD